MKPRLTRHFRTGIAYVLLISWPDAAVYAQEAPAPQPYSDELLQKGKGSDPARAYASDMGVSVSEARDRLALQQAAAGYAEALIATNPAGFVDLQIRHSPAFKVHVYYNKDIDRNALTSSAPVELRRFLVFRPVRAERATISAQLGTISTVFRNAKLPFGVEFDLEADRYRITIPEGAREENYRQLLPPGLETQVEFVIGGVSEDAAAIYGGWWWNNSGGRCTTGWPVRDSSAREAILTAGHCLPPAIMEFSDWWSGGPVLSTVYSSDNRIVSGQSVDYAFFALGTHTTARVINIQNDPNFVNPDGTRNYIQGITSAYYEIASPALVTAGSYVCKQGKTTLLTCGVIVSTSYSDSNVSNVVKVSSSAQGNIASSGDSGGPVFSWTNSNSQVIPLGIVKSTYMPGGVACKNTSTSPANNTTCFYTFSPLRTIRGYRPFTVNTVNGFLAP